MNLLKKIGVIFKKYKYYWLTPLIITFLFLLIMVVLDKNLSDIPNIYSLK